MTESGTGADVPNWCDFFDGEEFEEFCEQVDDACGSFGADGQDVTEGFVELATGAYAEIATFPLGRLAQRCRDSSREDWGDLCFAQVDAWSDGVPQAEWLESAEFARVRDGLRIHLYDGGAHYQGTGPDDPAEYARLAVADGLWAGLVRAETPSAHDDEPAVDAAVHNAAADAWGTGPERLVEVALANLRRSEPAPHWNVEGAVREATASAGWALLLDEVAPDLVAGGALVAVPAQDSVIVCPAPDEATRNALVGAVAELARQRVAGAAPGRDITDSVYWYHDGAFHRTPAPALP
ncbi:MAG: hypothetical protein WCA46_29315 [Actinocatenispora sp.]